MMSWVTKWLHPMTPEQNEDGSFNPSPLTLFIATASKSKYARQKHETVYTGSKPILVVCADVKGMKMANDKIFNTGTHPVEMLVPMLHFRDAGFTFEIATRTGGPVALEEWAFPYADTNVIGIRKELETQIGAPKKLSDIKSLEGYSAIFIPGGHGAMINLPTDADMGRLLHEAHEKKMPTVAFCHGPAALLSTKVGGKDFCYAGYDAVCFTDKSDDSAPYYGYLPGKLPWNLQSALEKEGLKVLNTTETGAVHKDRELITGDSPYSAHNLGVFAAPLLVEHAIAAMGVK